MRVLRRILIIVCDSTTAQIEGTGPCAIALGEPFIESFTRASRPLEARRAEHQPGPCPAVRARPDEPLRSDWVAAASRAKPERFRRMTTL